MNKNAVAIATNTFYPDWYEGEIRNISDTDKVRGDLALDFFSQACSEGYKVVVVDGESSENFCKTLKSFPLTILSRTDAKRSVARRLAIETSSQLSGVEVIVLTEQEKVSFITDCMAIATTPVLTGNADLVIAKREDGLFKKTYPKFQYDSETEANILINELYRSYGFLPFSDTEPDMIFGPRIFKNSPSVVACFMKKYVLASDTFAISSEFIDPEQVLNTMFSPIIEAEKQGLKIQNIVAPFKYPVIQKQNEEIGEKQEFIEKRRNQKIGILIGLMHFFRLLEGKESKIKEEI